MLSRLHGVETVSGEGACRCQPEGLDRGVSTLLLNKLLQPRGMAGISGFSVSELCKDINERVNVILKRPIAGGCIISGSMQPI
jgi:hypothetical protein